MTTVWICPLGCSIYKVHEWVSYIHVWHYYTITPSTLSPSFLDEITDTAARSYPVTKIWSQVTTTSCTVWEEDYWNSAPECSTCPQMAARVNKNYTCTHGQAAGRARTLLISPRRTVSNTLKQKHSLSHIWAHTVYYNCRQPSNRPISTWYTKIISFGKSLPALETVGTMRVIVTVTSLHS